MKQYYAYIRVSTVRQGEQRVSLPEQKSAIEMYARRHELEICRWFEERETAASPGRRVFGEMVQLLRTNSIAGVLIHKVDRSARNLLDYAGLMDGLGRSIEVHSVSEGLDFSTRSGRLTGDILAVVAADYSRNLREEAKKGFYGRLKQGLFPMPAPVGYINNGQGKVKTPDPSLAPLVRTAFELYATGAYNLETLGQELFRRGLRWASGRPVPKNRLSHLLNNEFYAGIIHIQKTGEYFAGAHEPLVSKRTFEQVQNILKGKLNTRSQKNDFLYRRRLSCKSCEYSLIGELQKGYVYYRCHLGTCPPTCVREDSVTTAVLKTFWRLRMLPGERRLIDHELESMSRDKTGQKEEMARALKLRLAQLDQRQNRLTDALIDGLLEKDAFESRKAGLISERLDLERQLAEWESGARDPIADLAKFLERANSAYLAYKSGLKDEKRDLLNSVTSNRLVDQKTLMIMLNLPFAEMANRFETTDGRPRRDIRLTWQGLLPRLTLMLVR